MTNSYRLQVDFHKQLSKQILVEMIEKAEETEIIMFDKLFEILEDYKRQSILEKENMDFECTTTIQNSRKRKLN